MSAIGEPAVAAPPAYLAALDEWSASVRNAHALAELLDYFAGQLRGARPDLDGPPLESCPSPFQVRRALARRDRALLAVEAEWERLPGEWKESLPPPGEWATDEPLV
jgi:hypothetical protein